MSERVPRVTEKTEVIADAVTLFVGKKVFEGWTDLSITRELNAAASDFQLQLVDKWRVDQEPWRVQPGDAVHIHVGKNSLLTGYVDKMEASVSANQRTVSIMGRSKTGDLVDCSADASGLTGLNIQEVAEKLCAPFGVRVVMRGQPGATFDTIQIQQGETVFAVLDRLARQRKLLVYPSYDGNLVFEGEGTRKARAELRQGVNVKSGTARFDNSNRFSKYITKGQDIGWRGSLEEKTVAPTGEATDGGITRNRPLIVVAEGTVDDASSEDRATYEASVRRAKSLEVEVELQGWFQPDGSLWEINEIVFTDIGFLGVRRKMLVKKVVFSKNGSGTTTTLTLILSGAFDFKKEKKKEDPLGWTKFTK